MRSDITFRLVKRLNFTEVLAGTVFAIEEKYRLALHMSSSRWKDFKWALEGSQT